jgi:ABC-2 type transport system ATP-binding protein
VYVDRAAGEGWFVDSETKTATHFTAGGDMSSLEQPDARVETPQQVLESAGIQTTDAAPFTLVGTLGSDGPEPEDIVAALVRADLRVRGITVERTSLEDRFVELTGQGFDVVA